MKRLLVFGFAILSSVTATAANGGSSTVGVGAPQYRFICSDASNSTSVRLLRFWPKYDVDHVSVSDNTGKIPQLNEVVSMAATETLLTFSGARTRFVLDLTTQDVRGDDKIVRGTLSVDGIKGEKQYECVDRTSKY